MAHFPPVSVIDLFLESLSLGSPFAASLWTCCRQVALPASSGALISFLRDLTTLSSSTLEFGDQDGVFFASLAVFAAPETRFGTAISLARAVGANGVGKRTDVLITLKGVAGEVSGMVKAQGRKFAVDLGIRVAKDLPRSGVVGYVRNVLWKEDSLTDTRFDAEGNDRGGVKRELLTRVIVRNLPVTSDFDESGWQVAGAFPDRVPEELWHCRCNWQGEESSCYTT